MSNPADNNYKKIPVSQLKPGMYVLSVSAKDNDINVKSEGYINNQQSIAKLKQSGIKSVTVDPSRERKTATTKINIETTPLKSKQKKTSISLDQEMKVANKLYTEAKILQKKFIDNINNKITLDIDEVKASTNGIVASIFRNQDALSCIARLRMKDEYLVEHSLNVSILMTMFAKHLNLEKDIIEQLTLGAFLHDIGKIKVPDKVLNKPGKLDKQEFEAIKEHVNLGVDILKDLPHISEISLNTVSSHHERLDGSGYPNGLSAENISLYGRMIAIVDSYDAMTAERIYKAGMYPIKAFKILLAEAPNGYDEQLVNQFVNCLGVYPIGTLVKLSSGKIGLVSKLNKSKPLKPFVRVFYNARLKQAIGMEEIDLTQNKYNDQIDRCIKPDEFNLNLLKFFKETFLT
ncbi:HD-GYP domain-containing protein [Thalassotalea sp. PLHSN55]|uniref:HD-GYP domain-containing protein n=1 Tax=Thalassotalea sp. PLHSN55 TaxID=3435888 RepID=UPI003F872652